jgi:hypothetical protein
MTKQVTTMDKATKALADKMAAILEIEKAERLKYQTQLMQVQIALIRQGVDEETKNNYMAAYANQALMETKRVLEAVTTDAELVGLMEVRKNEIGEGYEIDDTYCNLQNALIGIRKTV